MKNVNVLHLIDDLSDNDNSIFLAELSRELNNNNVLSLICANHGFVEHKLERYNIPYIPMELKTNNPFKFNSNLKKLKQIIEKFEINIIHTHSFRTAFIGYLLTKNTKIKLISNVTEYKQYKKHSINKLFDNFITKSSAIFAPSQFMFDFLIRNFDVIKKRIKIIPYGINIENYDPDKITPIREMDFVQKNNIHLEKKLITLITNVHLNHGFDTLLKTAQNLNRNDFCFVIAALNNFDDPELIEYKNKIKSLHLEEKIAIIEDLQNIKELLKTSHCFLSIDDIPTSYNFKLLIATAMHLPCIAVDSGANYEYLSKETGMFLSTNDSIQLENYINKLLNMTLTDRNQLKTKCLEYLDKFLIKKITSEYISEYNKILKK